jgi:hypothetical protein
MLALLLLQMSCFATRLVDRLVLAAFSNSAKSCNSSPWAKLPACDAESTVSALAGVFQDNMTEGVSEKERNPINFWRGFRHADITRSMQGPTISRTHL